MTVTESGGEEPCPLGGGKGQMPGIGVFGVADGGPVGEFGDLHAVPTGVSAVAALLPYEALTGGVLGHE